MQTRKSSAIEQCFNVGSGFIISMLYWQFAVVPQLEDHPHLPFWFNLWITTQFTVISVIRGYVWRRVFNWWQHERHNSIWYSRFMTRMQQL